MTNPAPAAGETRSAAKLPEFLVKDTAYFDEVWPEWREHPSALQHSLLTTNPPDHGRIRSLLAIWLHEYFARLAASRRADPRGGLVSALALAAETDGSVSYAELLGNLTLLLFADFETTTNLLGNGLHIIMTSPAIEAGLRSGEVGVPEFVSEVLRYDAPVQAGADRWCPADADLCGVPLAAGSSVIVLIGAANRDPRRFADPDVFDPSRGDGAALSFGAGPHYCLGAALARLEGQLAFRYLMTSFPRLTPAGEPVRLADVALRGFDQLPVTLA